MSLIHELQETIRALELSLAKSEKVRKVLMERVERSVESSGGAYALFENNILLQQKVQQRTEELEKANKDLLQEIAKRKETEETLKRERETFHTILENNPTGVVLVGPDGKYLYVNPEFTRITGYTLEDVPSGRDWLRTAYPDPDYQKTVVDTWREDRFSQKGKPVDREFTITRSDGKARIVDLRTTFMNDFSVTACSDVTERRQAEKALRVSHQRVLDIIEFLPDATLVVDHEKKVVAWNKAIEKMTGVRKEEIIGKGNYAYAVPFYGQPRPILIDLVFESDDEKRKKYDFIQTHGDTLVAEVYVPMTYQGKGAYLSATASRLFDPEGNVVGAIESIRDITEQKNAERALQRLNRELRAISECNQVLMRAEDEQALLTDICRIICDEAGYRMAWVGYVEHNDTKTVRPAAWAGVEVGFLANANVTWADTEQGRGPSGTAIRSGEPVHIQDSTTDPRMAPWRERALQLGYRSTTAFPLKDERGNTFGVLNISSMEANAFTPDEIRLLEELAGDLAFGVTVLRSRIERQRAEEKLKAANKRLEDTIEFLPDATFIIDRDKKIVAWNRAMEEMTGVPKRDVIGKDHLYSAVPFYGEPRPYLMDLVDKDDDEIASKYNYVKRRGGVLYAEVFAPALYGGKGAYVWATACPLIEGDGSLIGVIESIRDVTERRQAEEALKEAEKKYRDIFENSVMGIFQTTPGGRYLNVNKALSRMFGFDSSEEMMKEVTDIGTQQYVNPDERERLMEQYRTQGSVIRFETELFRKDGGTLWISLNGRAVKDSDGNILHYEGTTEDITERKRSGEERLRLETQLLQAQKMEAIGTLAGGIAHDFNNILTAIIGYGSLLQMNMDKTDPLKAYVEPIISAAQKAADLTKGLLTFGRRQPVALTPLDINSAIKGTKKLLERLLTEDIELITSFTEDYAIAMADKTQLDQILFNLITNARDAMPKGGTLTIETDVIAISGEFIGVHGFGEPGRYVQIKVSDTGMGIDQATRENIFDPFFTTKEVGKGTGLGLATVYGIVKQHGGYITVDSELNRGTVFQIYIPAVEIVVNQEEQRTVSVKRGAETILIAEDNEGVRHLMRDVLAKYGYKTIEATDGEDAIRKFTQHDDVDLIIVDSVMPKKNGREVYEEIHRAQPHIRVIFTSGYTKDVVLDKGIEGKDFHFIAKPLSPVTLLQKVREVLDG